MTKDKLYKVKEAFYTLQGEGAHAGRPAVFCRFSKCNLWNGRELSRTSSICNFCDTDFNGTDGNNGGTYSAEALTAKLVSLWPNMNLGIPYIVCTGGEPLLQLDEALISLFQKAGFEVGVETNGTLPAPTGIDWLCVSPKGASHVVIKQCDELKLIYPQPDCLPEHHSDIQATHYYLQPMASYQAKIATDNPFAAAKEGLSTNNTKKTIEYCLEHPKWSLSLQTHKYLEIE